jgi:FkbM family methyltransferase
VIMSNEYAPVIELMKEQHKGAPKLIIDAGANIGLSTIFFKSYFPNARVICIEPDPENITLLQNNLDENKFFDCDVIRSGLWYKDCRLALSHDFRDGLPWSITVVEQEDGEIRGLGIASLLESCKGERIGLLKIDIEGSEFELFKRMESMLPLLKQSDCIVAEIHEEFGSASDIQIILENNSFFCTMNGHILTAIKKI